MTDRASAGSFPGSRHAATYRSGAKRALDLALAATVALLLLPLILVLALAVRRDGGPAFFGHERVGLNGRTFRCWKLRTMVPDASAVLRRHLDADPAAAAEWERDHKLARDPRVTRLGRVLRATSLDELPQLWNVLVGDMSLVGPRPVTAEELARYRGHRDEVLSVRPGVTGMWQVSGRNDVSYDERVRLDVEYARACSLALDAWVLWRTVGTVLARTGR